MGGLPFAAEPWRALFSLESFEDMCMVDQYKFCHNRSFCTGYYISGSHRLYNNSNIKSMVVAPAVMCCRSFLAPSGGLHFLLRLKKSL